MWSRKIERRKRPRPDGPGASADALALLEPHVIEHRRSSTDERAPNHRPILRALSQELLARLSGPTLVPLGWDHDHRADRMQHHRMADRPQQQLAKAPMAP